MCRAIDLLPKVSSKCVSSNRNSSSSPPLFVMILLNFKIFNISHDFSKIMDPVCSFSVRFVYSTLIERYFNLSQELTWFASLNQFFVSNFGLMMTVAFKNFHRSRMLMATILLFEIECNINSYYLLFIWNSVERRMHIFSVFNIYQYVNVTKMNACGHCNQMVSERYEPI